MLAAAGGKLLSISENSEARWMDSEGDPGTGGMCCDALEKLLKLGLPGMCNPNPQVGDASGDCILKASVSWTFSCGMIPIDDV